MTTLRAVCALGCLAGASSGLVALVGFLFPTKMRKIADLDARAVLFSKMREIRTRTGRANASPGLSHLNVHISRKLDYRWY